MELEQMKNSEMIPAKPNDTESDTVWFYKQLLAHQRAVIAKLQKLNLNL